jgi:hypothetical protein
MVNNLAIGFLVWIKNVNGILYVYIQLQIFLNVWIGDASKLFNKLLMKLIFWNNEIFLQKIFIINGRYHNTYLVITFIEYH